VPIVSSAGRRSWLVVSAVIEKLPVRRAPDFGGLYFTKLLEASIYSRDVVYDGAVRTCGSFD
jgi:hypothetical protein